MKYLFLIAFSVLFSASANAADLCRATALTNIPKNSFGYTARKGERIDAVTQYVFNGKEYGFCSHGGGCYPERVTINGKRVVAVRLINCFIDRTKPDRSYGEIIYPVEVNRRMNSTADLRMDDVENRFLDLGMCSACAGTAAYAYVKRPASPCGQLARSALEGNPISTRRLTSDSENACTATWRK